MGRKLVFDVECDNLLFEATTVHCIVAKDIETGEVFTFSSLESNIKQGVSFLEEADLLIGHNIINYDIPVLKRLYGFRMYYSDVKKVVDTLIASQLDNADRFGGHSLSNWGQIIGFPKSEVDGFEECTPEMIEYCKRDVELNKIVFDHLKEYLQSYYDSFLLELKFAWIIQKQIEAGFTLDVPKVTELYNILQTEHSQLYDVMKDTLPKVKDKTHFRKVVKEDNLLDVSGNEYTYTTPKTGKIVTKEFKFDEPNPTSRTQLVDFFTDKGWVPQEFTDKGTAKISESILKGMPYPEAANFSRLFRLQKQMGMIKNERGGWLNYLDKDNRVHGHVRTCAANTRRCCHASPNLAQVDKKDKRMREVWIPKKGWKLVGCDASGLELRLLGHYLAPFDGGSFSYKASLPKDKFDIHADNQKIIGLKQRDSAKTFIYALIYGAGNKKLGDVALKDMGTHGGTDEVLYKEGSILRERVIQDFEGYAKLMKAVKGKLKTEGHLRAVDGGRLNPRSDYSALNLLIQSAGAIVMKKALIIFYEDCLSQAFVHGVDYNLVANVHDEVQIECKPEHSERLGKIASEAIRKAGKDLKLKVDLDAEYVVGDNWSMTH